MLTRRLAAALTAGTLIVGWASPGAAQDGGPPEISNLFAFGDSLTDTGNLFFLTGGIEPPSAQYFNGRFSNGPVWIEQFAGLLDLTIDFDTPFGNNQAIGGAFSDTRGEVLPGTGLLSQVDSFLAEGGTGGPGDLFVVWIGANNYFGGDAGPGKVVADLTGAIVELHLSGGAENFLVPNLPNLGDLSRGVPWQTEAQRTILNLRTQLHNTLLARAVIELRRTLGVNIVLVDINTAFSDLLENPGMFGFVNADVPCLIQTGGGVRVESGACFPPGALTFDILGHVFWDLIHPTTQAHALIAMTAHTAWTMSQSLSAAAVN